MACRRLRNLKALKIPSSCYGDANPLFSSSNQNYNAFVLVDWRCIWWARDGVIVAGGNGSGNGSGNGLKQLSHPYGMYLDDDSQCIYIADYGNNRIVEWKLGDESGRVVAGGNGKGSRLDQLDRPTDVIVDKETDSLIICDWKNRRVMRWPRRNGISGEIIIKNIDCFGLAMDAQRFLYISGEDRVTRYRMGDTNGIVVAGGHGHGNRLNQLYWASYVVVDRDQSVYVSDFANHRVMKWMKDSKEGIVVAGGTREGGLDEFRYGRGNAPNQVYWPRGLFVDPFDNVYVVSSWSHRVMLWRNEASQGEVVAGKDGHESQANPMHGPEGLAFDRKGNLYVVDQWNDRVLRFSVKP
ncbi:unnamed protein product [Rotaria magnacalcarata]|uniref:Uncharacterized protein n=1 Tax=Rotaria magnacalcarata TaxID=392030 RepID=A0A819DS94_9BILA|nr:unnamed protein product [Rotaria magnacalcarata]CAF3838012.1 unnamed protein product [Rotaria magnacalcarata]CAF3923052.1 unnamed protein product [Rotaria magnacalcarata]CAF4023096.1 unnamed protein product [Rotaria magnacalcarata]